MVSQFKSAIIVEFSFDVESSKENTERNSSSSPWAIVMWLWLSCVVIWSFDHGERAFHSTFIMQTAHVC
jgi:hypothetical protein